MAEADLYPRLAINGVLGYDAVKLPPLLQGSGFLGFIPPNFTWNILNYGRILNNVRAQKALLQELIATYQNKVLTANREVQIPLRGFLRSREQAEYLARSVNARGPPSKPAEISSVPAPSPSTPSSIWKPRRCNSKTNE